MDSTSSSPGSGSVSIGRDAIGSQLVTGSNNRITVSGQRISLPAPQSVDIRAEFEALRQQLAALDAPDQRKIDNALSDVEDELSRGEPDKAEIGKALDRALGYAKEAEGFARIATAIQPHVAGAAAWLGQSWHTLLAAVGAVAG